VSDLSPAAIGASIATALAAIAAFGPKLLRALKAQDKESRLELESARLPDEVRALAARMGELAARTADIEGERDRARSNRQRLTSQGQSHDKRLIAIETQEVAWHANFAARALKIQALELEIRALRDDLTALRRSHEDCDRRSGETHTLTARQEVRLDGLGTRLDDVAKRVSAISSARWSAHGGSAE
jgi:chromosome segregation ATPase